MRKVCSNVDTLMVFVRTSARLNPRVRCSSPTEVGKHSLRPFLLFVAQSGIWLSLTCDLCEKAVGHLWILETGTGELGSAG